MLQTQVTRKITFQVIEKQYNIVNNPSYIFEITIMKLNSKTSLLSAAIAVVGITYLPQAGASLNPAPYSNIGVESPETYAFTAVATGDLIVYFAGASSDYDNTLDLIVNGTVASIGGLNNHTSNYGASLNFGHVTAGDKLVFRLNVLTTGKSFFSDKSLNSDGINHAYSNFYSGDSSVPAGTYVAFEDLNGGGDLDYNDQTFVFTNVSMVKISSVPVPAAIWLFASGLVGLASFKRRKTVSE